MTQFSSIGPLPETPLYRSAVIFAKDAQGRVLMQLRDDYAGIAAPGQWCLFGGGVDIGEDLTQAAKREFEEETGLRLGGHELHPAAAIASEWHQDGVLYVFRASRIIDPHAIRLAEGAGFACLTARQCATYPLVPSAAAIVRKLGVNAD